jgi:hypothetical protein
VPEVDQPQEPSLTSPESCHTFQTGTETPLMVTPAALERFGMEAILVCFSSLPYLARLHHGLALCVLHHKTFDLGVFTLNQDGVLLVSDQANGTQGFEESLLRHHAKPVRRPSARGGTPQPIISAGTHARYSRASRGMWAVRESLLSLVSPKASQGPRAIGRSPSCHAYC